MEKELYNFNRSIHEYNRTDEPTSHIRFMAHHINQPPKRRRNLDVPGDPILYDAGCEALIGYQELFAIDMDKRDFSERCVARGNTLHRLELRTGDSQAWHLQPARIAEWLQCTHGEAVQFSEVWKKLDMDRAAVIKLIFGYVRNDGVKTTGLQKTGNQYLAYYQELTTNMQDLFEQEDLKYGMPDREETESYDFINDGNELHIYTQNDVQETYLDEIIAKQTEAILEEYQANQDEWFDNNDPEVMEMSLLEDLDVNGNTFTTREFGTPELSLNEHTIQYLKRASYDQIAKIQKQIFDPPWKKKDGHWYKFRIEEHLTPSAISELWERIASRKEQLAKIRVIQAERALDKGLSDQVYDTIQFYMENYKYNPKQAKFRLSTQAKGGTFTIDGERLRLRKPKDQDEVALLWAIWRDEIAV